MDVSSKGVKTGKLPRFDADCWELMGVLAWRENNLIGDVALRLHLIMERVGRTPLR